MSRKTSASFPHVSEDEVKSILPSEFTHIITDSNEVTGENVVSLKDFNASPNQYLRKGGKYLFVFDNVHRADAKVGETLSQYDAIVQGVSSNLEQLTNGEFVALFSAQKATPAPNAHSRHILSATSESEYDNQVYSARSIKASSTDNPYSVYVNGTTNNLMIDGEIAGGTVVGLFLVFWAVVAIVVLMSLSTAPHMTDIEVSIEKKSN